MTESSRLQPIDAALLAGSVIRGQATSTSDLDIIVLDEKLVSPYGGRLFQGYSVGKSKAKGETT